MVMHARKLPRITDGFSEKHQAHGYENSKYSNKYRYSNHDKSRDSPSTNSLRSSSPDSHSQSPRYHKGNYYSKVRDKDRDRENRERDRDRDREREYKEYRDREGSRSPKERRRERERERERDHRESRGIHDRINSVHKKEEKERLMRVGDWSEHVSSSGKKYYYNCRTEVSQWEKPPEWLEWERSHRSSGSSAPGGNHSCKETSLSSVGLHRNQHDKNRQDKHSTLVLGDGYRESRDLREPDRERREFRNDDPYERRENRKYVQDVGTTDMDISSGDSTPTSESHHARCSGDGGHDGNVGNTGNSHLSSNINQHLGSSDHFSRPMSKFSNLSNMVASLSTSLASSLPGSGGTVTTLTGTNDHHADDLKTSNTSNSLGNSVSTAMPQLLNSHPRLMNLSNSLISSDTKGGVGIPNMNSSSSVSYSQDCNNLNSRPQLEPLNIATNSNNIGAGPPTPTHSENQDGIDIRKIGSPNSCLNSLQSLVPSSSNSGSISLTPSLANYYKETLICHVQSWPSEPIEKQCQRLSEEAHTISSIIMTKVSADLKMARSMVRHAEILSMLQEQRILFLRSQKSNLEEMKSQNCFMNDT